MIALVWLLACTEPEPEDHDGPPTASELRDAVDGSAYSALVAQAAILRTPGSAGWQEVQDLCADTLAEHGFEVSLHDFGIGINVIGTRQGTGVPGTVIFGAHYDHISGCTGADDNASGVAGVLEAARVLGPEAWQRDLVIACWDQEERGLLGSEAWVADNPDLEVTAYLNFDMIAAASDAPGSQSIPPELELIASDQTDQVHEDGDRADFIAVLADTEGSSDTVSHFATHADALGLRHLDLLLDPLLVTSPLTAELRRSDHASFWEAGHPGIFFSDTADYRYDGYHCRGAPDEVDRLDLDFATQVVAATVGTAAEVLER